MTYLRFAFALLLALLFVPLAAVALEPTEADTADESLFNEAADPADSPAATGQPADKTGAEAAPAPAVFNTVHAEQLQWALQRLTDLSDHQIALEEENARLKQQLQAMEVLAAKVETLEAQLAGVDDLARREADSALGRMADDPVLRTEFGRQLQGRLNLNNTLGVEKVVFINGTAWTVRTGESYIYVPVGKVSIQESLDGEPIFIDLDQWAADAGQMVVSYTLR
jgi:hypothetical protein